MPDDIKDKKDGGGDGSGAGDGGGGGNGSGDGGGNAGEETVTIKKSEWEKTTSDLENYRKGLLGKKADERELKDGGGESGDGKGGEGGAGKGAGDGKGAGIDETKVKEIADASAGAALSEIHKSNENRAKRHFLQKHGEYLDDAQWADLMTDFRSKRGKATVEDIIEDLEDAVLLHKKRTGKLDEHLAKERERGRGEGRAEEHFENGSSAGGASDRDDGRQSEQLSPDGERMARGMHVDPAKAAKIDPKKDGVIDVTKPQK